MGDQLNLERQKHPVIVVGAGPTGLTLAIDLAQRGQAVVLIDGDVRRAAGLPSEGSKAICFAKRTLEIWDKLGVGERMMSKGVPWHIGKVFLQDAQIYRFDLQAQASDQRTQRFERPAFINLQQYYVEEYLMDKAKELPLIDIRLGHAVQSVKQGAQQATLTVASKDGEYDISARYVVACDGSKSTIKRNLGLESRGRVFQDRFLIVDVRMTADFPAERWFWFDPPFHPGQSVLLHRQPDNVWRIDFQLGWDADPEEEKNPERIEQRVKTLLHKAGMYSSFELVWASVYTFACSRMEKFVHDRVIFAGDAAHGVSPFGARGANSGVQDAENLAWKLALILKHEGKADAPNDADQHAFLSSYGHERELAAEDNILQSTRSTDFITPKSEISHLFRRAVLDLTRQHPFARALVNSGRLSTATLLTSSPLHTDDAPGDIFSPSAPVVGEVVMDTLLEKDYGNAWLLRELGADFSLLVFGEQFDWLQDLWIENSRLHVLCDPYLAGYSAKRYDAKDGTAYLIRPDGHIAARWRSPTVESVLAALNKASGGMDHAV